MPRLSLQVAPLRHVASALAPALSSHFAEALQSITLPGPPFPLHSAAAPQLMLTAAVESAAHFVSIAQLRAHSLAPQLA